jgi:RNA recognition motif-containing protein
MLPAENNAVRKGLKCLFSIEITGIFEFFFRNILNLLQKMPSQSAIRISGLNNKVTVPVLESNFSLVGPVLKVDLYDDLQSNKCAQVVFASEELAMKAVEQYNGKQLLKNQISVEIIKVRRT